MKINKKEINMYDTLFSGQCFRMKLENDSSIINVIKDRVINIKEEKDFYIIDSNKHGNLVETVSDYLDLERDYDSLNKTLREKDKYMSSIIDRCEGYKILKQNPFEVFISYIISQNNNVKRISKSVDMISEAYGEKVLFRNESYYLFPTYESLKNVSKEELRGFGIGFRDKYVINALDKLRENPDFLLEINNLSTEDALKELMTIKGIGLKVASCILLFGYGRLDVFPIDTWVKHNIKKNYKEVKNDIKSIEKFAKDNFGEYSGLAIQYMYHSKRNLD